MKDSSRMYNEVSVGRAITLLLRSSISVCTWEGAVFVAFMLFGEINIMDGGSF